MPSRLTLFTILLGVLLLTLVPQAKAFGAGNIPAYAFLEDKAFRHGDIEDILSEMAKTTTKGFLGLGGAAKFNGLDVKRIYFGNWLRDYSQAIDIATLKKTDVQTIINLLMVMGFMTFGYVTEEFEITAERIGCYLPTEHLDNPKGYGGGEDPRKYHPKLRPPIDPRELQIDPRTGMKNYLANESGNWETSTALVRRTLVSCINLMRQARNGGRKEDEYEALRLLGSALHQLEDFSAHSNFCELSLISFGYKDVFPHVGNHARVRSPSGQMVPPLVTGTFGGNDFALSMLGEAGDKLSENSVSDLNTAVKQAREADPTNTSSGLRSLLGSLPGSEGQQMSRDMDDIGSSSRGDPNTMSTKELHDTIWKILAFRDKVMKIVDNTVEKMGLSSVVEKISNAVNAFVFTALEPYIGPILRGATGGLGALQAEVINDPEQFEVFDNPNSDDPTHSFLAKDHFNNILNEPAGNIAKIIIRHAIDDTVRAWDDHSIDPRQVADTATSAFHHPDFATNSNVQREMREYMQGWIEGQGSSKREVLNRLSKKSVRDGDNTRIGSTEKLKHDHGAHGGGPGQGLAGQLGPSIGGGGQYGQGGGNWRGGVDNVQQHYQAPTSYHQQPIHHQQPSYEQPSYQQPSYEAPSYPSHHQDPQPSYGQPSYGGGYQPEPSYSAPPHHQGSYAYQPEQPAFPPHQGGFPPQHGQHGHGGPPPPHWQQQQHQGGGGNGYHGQYGGPGGGYEDRY